jgi:carbon monoxide dehydrogenase subunit G
MWMLLAAALASTPPTAVLTDDGAIEGVATVAAPPDRVKAQLADPAWVAKVGGGPTTVELAATEGNCLVLDYTSPNAIMTARYRVRQCPGRSGPVATLVESNTFLSYRTEWKVEPDGAGSLLTYRLELEPKVLIPTSLVRRASRSSVEELMVALVAAFQR